MFGRRATQEEEEWVQAGYRYALSLTHHAEDAEDLVQTACVKLYSKYGRLKHKALFFKTVRNIFIDERRRGARARLEPLDESISPAREQSKEGQSLDFEQLLARLRSEEREVLYLHIIEGYTAREIAKLSGQSRNTVLSLIHRGKQKLQRAVANDAAV